MLGQPESLRLTLAIPGAAMRCLCFAGAVLVLVQGSPADQPPPPASKPDGELIQGSWSIIGLEAGGKAEPEKTYRGNTFTFSKDKALLQERGHPPIDFTYTLDPTKSPKAIDLVTAKGSSPLRGIYKLAGDDLVLCLSLGGGRPTEFVTRPGGDTETFTLKRIRWQRFTDKTIGASVELPGPPEEGVRPGSGSGPASATTLYTVRHELDRVSYLFGITPLPGKLSNSEMEDALDAAQKLLLAEIDRQARGKLEGDVKGFKPLPGVVVVRELTLAVETPEAKERTLLRMRLFIFGDRLYSLAVAGVEEGVRSPNVTRFWNSFRLPSEKKEPPRKQ
jgi:uncharacterized protein (TIGR03067 family)